MTTLLVDAGLLPTKELNETKFFVIIHIVCEVDVWFERSSVQFFRYFSESWCSVRFGAVMIMIAFY